MADAKGKMEPSRPRKVFRQRRGHAAHHGGAWKVAYADFVTAMMALFLVLWLVGQNQKLKQSVAQYFKNPGVSKTSRDVSVLPGGNGILKDQAPGQKTKTDKEEQSKQLAALADVLRRYIESTPEFKDLKDQIRIELVAEGLRIQIIDKENAEMFEIGSSKLKPSTVDILHKIAEEVSKLPNNIVLEGYTDSHQYGQPQVYGNWELSTDRANNARRVMEGAGARAEQIVRVTGYADKRLFNPSDPFDATNRRISITILYRDESVSTTVSTVRG